MCVHHDSLTADPCRWLQGGVCPEGAGAAGGGGEEEDGSAGGDPLSLDTPGGQGGAADGGRAHPADLPAPQHPGGSVHHHRHGQLQHILTVVYVDTVIVVWQCGHPHCSVCRYCHGGVAVWTPSL